MIWRPVAATNPVHLYRLALVLLLVSMSSACGFQPRGQSLETGPLPDTIAIVGLRVNSPLHRELDRQITAAGSALAGQAEADMVLRISGYISTSRLLSVDSSNRAVEFELEESARFSSTDATGNPLTASQTARVLRILYRPPDTLLAGDREEALLREDMRRDLVARILRRLAAGR
jgi:outer membrane lipopolysaccharide assembly protein LptE/RlpB